MTTKKELIIQAFENLDAEMLDILLDDDKSYQDVPKQIFVDALKKQFAEIRTYDDTKFDFKSYKGQCDFCQKGKSGYSFVNSEGQCYMSLVFEEDDDNFTDIYSCGSFMTEGIEIENTWVGVSFFEEEKTDFKYSPEILSEEEKCLRGVGEIKSELEENGILSSDFYVYWYEKYEYLDPIKRLFEKKSYKYTEEIGHYLFVVRSVVTDFKKNDLAKSLYFEFLNFPVITKDTIMDWLIKADHAIPYAKYGIGNECNFMQDYFEDKYFKYRLSELYYYHSVAEILNKYFDWIPEENPLTEAEKEYGQYDDDDDLPF